MNRLIYIFGTDHKYQREDPSLSQYQIDKFKTDIEKLCVELNIRLLAEENNLEAQEEHALNHSLLHQSSNKLNIEHIYCDPNRRERNEHGIQQENDIRASFMFKTVDEQDILKKVYESHKKRESLWLNRIEKVNTWPVLVLCGSNHVNSFSNLVKEQGYKLEILFEDWHA